MTDYLREANEMALTMVEECCDGIIDQILRGEEVDRDFRDDRKYPNADDWFWESVINREYSLLEAAQVLDQLPDWMETDSDLWHGQAPSKAIRTQAAFTFGAAVEHYWCQCVRAINWYRSEDKVLRDTLELPTDELTTPLVRSEVTGWILAVTKNR